MDILFSEHNILVMLLEEALSRKENSVIFTQRYTKENREYVELLLHKVRTKHIKFVDGEGFE